MIFTDTPRRIRVMFTPFRDGLQSTFGGKVRLEDVLPAMEKSAELGIRHFEFGGGALFQAPLFYLGRNPFENMRRMREAVGSEVDLQILTRSVSGVTLTTQSPEALELQGRLMAAAGTTWDRNFDYMNDVRNLVRTGQPIVDAGMHHQVVIALMGLPFDSDRVHTSEFYIDIGRQILESGMRVDSICLKDASGTTDPVTVYRTAQGLKKIMPPEMPLWMHTHDTASTGVACYMAAIHGGVDGVDLAVRPLAGGTAQPDGRALAHALKGTGYTLDLDVSGLPEVEAMLEEGLSDYQFNPTTTTPDARVLGFPMPGGAIGPNVHMMAKAGILERYGEVLAEFPVVVKAGGAWTSVTPGSQQYWLQAFNNVLYGRWERIDAGYGKAVLGYFGRTPLPPDSDVVERASEQLGLEPFEGDPLDAAPNNIPEARQALEARELPTTDENIFLVLAAMVSGKRMDGNEGIRLLTGTSKIDIPLKKDGDEEVEGEPVRGVATDAAPATTGPFTTRCTVEEGGTTRTFTVTLEPVAEVGGGMGEAGATVNEPEGSVGGTAVYSTFAGAVEVVDIKVAPGDAVREGDVIAMVEAMKATHEIRSPRAGTVTAVHATAGDEIDSTTPILTVG
ncbi:MAG: biotin/lipoyl-containing protein [Gemmatimonadota bacterium]|nr:biotin/lipoyl-containing protein [Gemmatimonadota bacterium]